MTWDSWLLIASCVAIVVFCGRMHARESRIYRQGLKDAEEFDRNFYKGKHS